MRIGKAPDRITFDRRFKADSLNLKSSVNAMGGLLISEGLIDPYIVSVDSSLLKARGGVWHKNSMSRNLVPHHSIDVDARWGYSRTKNWLFGYKIHIVCSTGSLIAPLSAFFTTANVQDNQMYGELISSLLGTRYVNSDEGYDDHPLYKLSRQRGFELVCPVARRENTPPERQYLIHFYESELGRLIYSWRSKSVEPLIEHIKDVFGIDPLPVRGFHNAESITLLSVLLYQVMVYYNHLNKRPLRALKHMLGN